MNSLRNRPAFPGRNDADRLRTLPIRSAVSFLVPYQLDPPQIRSALRHRLRHSQEHTTQTQRVRTALGSRGKSVTAYPLRRSDRSRPRSSPIKTAGLIAAAVLVLALGLPARGALSPAPLLRAIRARTTAAYRGEQIVATWNGDTTQVILVHVEHDPPAWSRLDYGPVGSSRRWTILRQGSDEIQYDPVTHAGTRTTRLPTDDDAFTTNHLPWLLENYRLAFSGGTLLARKTDRVEMRPVANDRPSRRIEIDEETGVILRSERIGVDGRLGEVTAFISFETMPAGWRKDTAPPRNLALTRQPRIRTVTLAEAAQALGGTPVEVATPPGFHRVADYLTENPGPVLQTVYSDGLNTLVVYHRRGAVASPNAGSRVIQTRDGPVWVQQLGLRSLAHWSHAGWQLTVVGDVSVESLVQAAERTGVASAPRIWERLLHWLRSLTLPL